MYFIEKIRGGKPPCDYQTDSPLATIQLLRIQVFAARSVFPTSGYHLDKKAFIAQASSASNNMYT